MATSENHFTDGTIEIEVWWIPQIPMATFHYPVPTLDTGMVLCNALARYDLFQYEHKIRPDYSNAGGIRYRHPLIEDGDWQEVDPDDERDMTEARRDCNHFATVDPATSKAMPA